MKKIRKSHQEVSLEIKTESFSLKGFTKSAKLYRSVNPFTIYRGQFLQKVFFQEALDVLLLLLTLIKAKKCWIYLPIFQLFINQTKLYCAENDAPRKNTLKTRGDLKLQLSYKHLQIQNVCWEKL